MLKQWISCASLLGAIVAGPALAAVPVEHFFKNAQFSGAKLSPSGRYVAVLVGNGKQRDGLAVLDLESGKVDLVARYDDADVYQFSWVNEQRLVYNVNDNLSARGDMQWAPGLYAANRDGSAMRQLVRRGYTEDETSSQIVQRLQPWNTFLLGQPGPQNDDYVYTVRGQLDQQTRRWTQFSLVRINTATGQAESIKAPAAPQDWLLDERGQPRLMMSQQEGKRTVHYLDPVQNTWRTLSTFSAYGHGQGSYTPVGFAPGGKLLVEAQADQDVTSLRELDLATGQLGQPLVSLPGFDFSGEMIYSDGRLLGYEVLTDGRTTVWLDEGMKAVQKAVDGLLPGTINVIIPPAHPETPWLLVRSYSDQQPSIYFAYNRNTGKLRPVGATHPEINAADMAQQDLKYYAASDGRKVPAWLTLPKGGRKNLPMVVLVHGGPFMRGSELQWDAEVQFLASRGYAVLQPEYRGSMGFGYDHFHAGWKQWGLAMQNDVADAARWAIAQGIADPKRICIAGASYGGYATLMGLLKDAQLFQCGVAWAGVTDIGLLYRDRPGALATMSDLPVEWRQYGMPELVGDPVKDAAQLNATSPLQQAARITRPLLLAHGTSDRRVPLEHARQFYAAVKPANKDVELVEYTSEGHGWSLPENRINFWTRVEQFLDKHIGAGRKSE